MSASIGGKEEALSAEKFPRIGSNHLVFHKKVLFLLKRITYANLADQSVSRHFEAISLKKKSDKKKRSLLFFPRMCQTNESSYRSFLVKSRRIIFGDVLTSGVLIDIDLKNLTTNYYYFTSGHKRLVLCRDTP